MSLLVTWVLFNTPQLANLFPKIVQKMQFHEYVKFGAISWNIDIFVNAHLIKIII